MQIKCLKCGNELGDITPTKKLRLAKASVPQGFAFGCEGCGQLQVWNGTSLEEPVITQTTTAKPKGGEQ